MNPGSFEHISWLSFVLAFGGGVMVSLSPCVYPLLPVVVSVIGANKTRSRREGFFRAVAYVLGLALVYAGIGAVVALTGGIFGTVQNNFWVNLFVANIFIFMGLCMLDVFTLPNISLRFFGGTAGGQGAANRGFFGVFLTGAASGLVAGPCTTAALGGILAYVAAQQNLALGMSLLFTYALGMGFPLLIVGASVSLLQRLPKAGTWTLRLKKVFGLLLIASGEYFLIGMR
ncbi:MAG: sulfite exporter TauE/SafE family protein [Candidatus Omnitrophica bacterium]|nr:sulfite exporter TauE/SafE family protein [Candidatus Omnitrophota bacterium]